MRNVSVTVRGRNAYVPNQRSASTTLVSGALLTPFAAITLLTVLVVLLRLPFQINVLDHWDSVQYALGLDHFDISEHTPHPPGAPFSILLARLIVPFVGDAHRAFMLMSLVASAAAVALVFFVTDRIFGRAAAWIASLALLTEPPFWMYGAAGNLWTLLAALSALMGLECYRVLRGARYEPLLSAVIMGLASGFRLDIAVFLGPLWLWSLWRSNVSGRARAAAISMAGLGIASWLVPVVAMTPGGLERWLMESVQLFLPSSWPATDLSRGLLSDTAIIWLYTLVLFGPILGCAFLFGRGPWHGRLRMNRELLVFFGLWTLPSFVFLWLFDTTEAGHALLFTVGLMPPVAGLFARVQRQAWIRIAAVSGIIALQAAAFIFGVPGRDRPGAYVANVALLRYTAEGLREHQQNVIDMESVIRSRFSPSDTLVATTYGQIPFRFAMFYLHDYTVLRVNEPDGTALVARDDRMQFVRNECVDQSVKSIVWVSEPDGAQLAPSDAVALQPPATADTLRWRLMLENPAAEPLPLPGIARCPF